MRFHAIAPALLALCLAVPPALTFAQQVEHVGGIVFVHLPGGCFDMGSPPDESHRDDNEDLHRVCVKPFAIGKHEISNAQFRRFKPDHRSTLTLSDDGQPAVQVTWHMAVAFAEWLSKKTGRHFRLPTEAEWEYAARGDTQTPRPWGAEARGAGLSVCEECGTPWDARRTAPIGSLPPNPFGLHDMLGNAWEWTCSAYDREYRGGEQVCSDNLAIDTRVRRGGGWADSAPTNRSANRSRALLDYSSLSVGLRLVLETDTPTRSGR